MYKKNQAGGGGSLEIPGIANPNRERRDYALNGESPLAGLLDNPWYPPYVTDRSHYHNCMEVGLCVSGSGRIEIGRQAWDYAAGAIAVSGRGLRHNQQNTDEHLTHWRYVLVDEDVILRETPQRHRVTMKKLIDAARRQGLFFEPGDESVSLRVVLDALFEVHARRGDMARMELEALVYLMMSIMSRTPNSAMAGAAAPSESREPIEPALNFVSENYMREIRMRELADSCAMSESYFRKVFVRIMGMPPLEYVNRYRINRSINLLRATNETTLSIAGRVGFTSIATYNRCFQRYVGTSPAEWRKNAHI